MFIPIWKSRRSRVVRPDILAMPSVMVIAKGNRTGISSAFQGEMSLGHIVFIGCVDHGPKFSCRKLGAVEKVRAFDLCADRSQMDRAHVDAGGHLPNLARGGGFGKDYVRCPVFKMPSDLGAKLPKQILKLFRPTPAMWLVRALRFRTLPKVRKTRFARRPSPTAMQQRLRKR